VVVQEHQLTLALVVLVVLVVVEVLYIHLQTQVQVVQERNHLQVDLLDMEVMVELVDLTQVVHMVLVLVEEEQIQGELLVVQ
tara:strand:- start:344 stop:589 length:246 start_codon:yes stop_codon:yes gene_type:complete